ncbi:small ribosomal subunit protein uS9m isoform X2 [Eurosta solidaginis]|uniref:small ribosomal subunit protein uS9m isoform X2 n=1 Tax=Eurosta solidaginis TaxID=178769 RepID=UPI0035305687
MALALRFGINQLKSHRNSVQNVCRISGSYVEQMQERRCYGTEVTVQAAPLAVKKTKVSKAMKAYLERAREHDEFMKTQKFEYQVGKRHLANMMGEDPETFTQEDVDDIVEEMNKLYDLEERMLRRGIHADPNQKVDLTGFQWLPKDQLEKQLVEFLNDLEYTNFTNAMDRLISLPFSYKSRDFFTKFTKPLLDQTKQLEIPKPQFDADGRQYVTIYECLRKTARGDVTIRLPGTGKITINGQDITYFEELQSREQVLFPLIFAEMLGKVDVEANIAGGGPSGQAGAIRWGIAMGLRSFVDQEMIESMRLAGLLQRDYRCRERKKFGQEGARRKYTWKKR